MTDLDLRAGRIHRGLGIVARWPDLALVIPSESTHDGYVDQMFEELGPDPGTAVLIRAVEDLLAENRLNSVGMLVEATGGPMAMTQGAVEILVDGVVMLDGGDGSVREQMSARAGSLTIRASNMAKAAEPVPPYDLRRGIAPGAGLTLLRVSATMPPQLAVPDPSAPLVPGHRPGPAPADPADPVGLDTVPPPSLPPSSAVEPSASPPGIRSGRFDQAEEPVPPSNTSPPAYQAGGQPGAMVVPFRSVLLVGRDVWDMAEPLPLASAPETGELTRGELDAGRALVNGILCSRDHFNNPEAAYCMVCGISMLHLTHNLVRGPRPTLGFIVFDDGSTFGLDRSYVIGREPVSRAGSEGELLVLHDNNETLSRTHAELQLVDWTVQLIDLESTNGTYVWDRTFERWNQLAPGHPVTLGSGDTVALGRRTLVFESVSRNG